MTIFETCRVQSLLPRLESAKDKKELHGDRKRWSHKARVKTTLTDAKKWEQCPNMTTPDNKGLWQRLAFTVKVSVSCLFFKGFFTDVSPWFHTDWGLRLLYRI